MRIKTKRVAVMARKRRSLLEGFQSMVTLLFWKERGPYGTLSAELRPYYVKILGEDFFWHHARRINNYAEYMGRDKSPFNAGLDQARLKMERLAFQKGDIKDKNGRVFDLDSHACWAAATYHTNLAMYPYFRLMYQNFSGDDSGPEGYDSLHSGFTSWNRFFVGEMVGEELFVGDLFFDARGWISWS